MKCLVYTYSNSYTMELAIELIPLGLEPIESESEKQVVTALETEESIHMLITENYNLDFLEKVKSLKKTMPIFLLVHENLKPGDLMKLIKIGITSVLQYNQNPAIMADEIIKNIIANNIRTQEKRLHVRIQPKSFEQIAAAIYDKALKKFYRGMVLDISAGGVAVRLSNPADSYVLIPGKIYDPVIVSIKGAEIKTTSMIVAQRQDIVALKYDNVEPKDMKKIAEYIHYQIQENAKRFMSRVTL